MKETRQNRGFTLIELLIVVAIIAILAAIAVPNFLEAQTRSKVSRTRADLRTIVTALESYKVDNNEYPHLELYRRLGFWQWNRGGINAVFPLTTPVAYLTTLDMPDQFQPPAPTDEFGDIAPPGSSQTVARTYNYVNIDLYRRVTPELTPISVGYVVLSYGPDTVRGPTGYDGLLSDYAEHDPSKNNWFVHAHYDPTNGTVSGGDILRFQGH